MCSCTTCSPEPRRPGVSTINCTLLVHGERVLFTECVSSTLTCSISCRFHANRVHVFVPDPRSASFAMEIVSLQIQVLLQLKQRVQVHKAKCESFSRHVLALQEALIKRFGQQAVDHENKTALDSNGPDPNLSSNTNALLNSLASALHRASFLVQELTNPKWQTVAANELAAASDSTTAQRTARRWSGLWCEGAV